MPTWQKKLADYYFSNDMTDLKDWTYQNGISGMEPNLQARAEHKSQELSANEEKETIAEFKKMLKVAAWSKQGEGEHGRQTHDSQAELAKKYAEQQEKEQQELGNDGLEL